MNDELLRALGREQEQDLERPSPLPDDGRWSEAGQPFDGGEREALLDAVLDQVETGSSQAPETARPNDTDSSDVVELSGASRRHRVALVGGLLALAAALVLWLMVRPGDERSQIARTSAYSITQTRGGITTQRVDHDPALRFHPDASIDWVLTPDRVVATPAGLAILAEPVDAPGTQVVFSGPVEVEQSEEGAIRLRGTLSNILPLSPGRWRLSLYVAAPQQLPAGADAARTEGPWHREPIVIEVVPRDP